MISNRLMEYSAMLSQLALGSLTQLGEGTDELSRIGLGVVLRRVRRRGD